MIKNEILAHANIPKDWWTDCYIDGNDMIFTPRFSENNVMIATGTEVYQELINQPPITPALSISDQVDTLQNSLLAAQQAIEGIYAKFKPESGICKLSLLTYGTSNSSATITQNVKYVKIANVVFVDGSITVEAVPANWTASIDIVQLVGMPFATQYTTTGTGSYSNSNAGYTGIWLSTSNNQTYIGKTNVAQALTYRPGLVAREIKVGDVFNISTKLIV